MDHGQGALMTSPTPVSGQACYEGRGRVEPRYTRIDKATRVSLPRRSTRTATTIGSPGSRSASDTRSSDRKKPTMIMVAGRTDFFEQRPCVASV